MFVPATIISIEGPDRVGKETQTKLLFDEIERLGFSVKRVEVPIKSLITHHLIYWMLRNGLALKLPTTFQFIQFINKLWFQLFTLTYYRWKYSFIVLDRWSHSALIYGLATGVPSWIVKTMFWLLVKPDVTISICGESFSRKEKDDSYEADTTLQRRVRIEYAKLGIDNISNKNYIEISNAGSREQTHLSIKEKLKEHF